MVGRRVSVVIVNWNGKHFLRECLEALRAQSFTDFNVVLVDNGSVDGSVDFVRSSWGDVEIIELDSNVGFSEGNNVGIRASVSSEFVVTLNNDTVPEPKFLEEMVRCADDGGSRVGSVASKMLFYRDLNRINSCGILALRDGGGRDIGVNEQDGDCFGMEKPVFGACAGAALYRVSALVDVCEEDGFFDPGFFAYFEDVDLAFRLQSRGWVSVFCPRARVLHHGRGSSGSIPGISVRFGQANRLKVLIKNFPLSLLVKCLPWIMFRQVSEFVYCSASAMSLNPVRARVAVLRELNSLLGRRTRLARRRTHCFSSWLAGQQVRAIVKQRL